MTRALLVRAALLVAALAACDGGATSDAHGGPVDAAAGDLGCYSTRATHVEILNACTTAQAVDKVPVTPLRRPDGTLPPLP